MLIGTNFLTNLINPNLRAKKMIRVDETRNRRRVRCFIFDRLLCRFWKIQATYALVRHNITAKSHEMCWHDESLISKICTLASSWILGSQFRVRNVLQDNVKTLLNGVKVGAARNLGCTNYYQSTKRTKFGISWFWLESPCSWRQQNSGKWMA